MLIQILDVLIGLTVVYIVFSSAASAAAELLEAAIRRRGKLLHEGIEELLQASLPGTPKDAVKTLLHVLYNSPQLAALFPGRMSESGQVASGSKPSYIRPDRFAAAVAWLKDPQNDAAIGAVLGGKDTPENRALVLGAFGDLARIAVGPGVPEPDMAAQLAAISASFEASTERIAGWYRRHVQFVLFVIGLAMALVFNLDTLRIAKTLSQDPVLRTQIVETALKDIEGSQKALLEKACAATDGDTEAETAKVPEQSEALNEPDQPSTMDEEKPGSAVGSATGELEQCASSTRQRIAASLDYAEVLGLPIGWDNDSLFLNRKEGDGSAGGCGREAALHLLQKLAGLLITALAICMGAPFWFDMLNKLASARTSLKPPAEEKKEA